MGGIPLNGEERPLPESLGSLIVALCRDYGRRRGEVGGRTTDRRVTAEYNYLDRRIYDGACEIVGEELGLLFIREIGEAVGYANSAAPFGESHYKRLKREVKINIAKKPHYF